jgi:hypothetical protein
MNRAFEYNGSIVAPSRPVKQLRTVKKTLLIDSADRDSTKYYTNGDVVYYLPRVYENVVSIRLKSLTLTPIANQVTSPPSGTALIHPYSNGQNIASATWANDYAVNSTVNYILVDIEGLNKCDETTVSAQRSSFIDSYFARIPLTKTQNTYGNTIINYNDRSEEENITMYYPAISKLDRMHIVMRTHNQQDKSGFIYWTTDSEVASSDPDNRQLNYSMVFELEMLENGFDEFSSFETRINNREVGNYGC